MDFPEAATLETDEKEAGLGFKRNDAMRECV